MSNATFDRMPETALRWHQAGQGAVLATVVQTWGSAPRAVGSQMAVSGAGEIAGSVSGGCVEGAVVLEAQEALEHGQSRLLTYGVDDGTAFAAGLACGGTIRILVEPVGAALREQMLGDLVEARAARRAVAYQVDTDSWARQLVPAEEAGQTRSGFAGDGVRFVALHIPDVRLIVVGAAHIAQALVPMARLAGFAPILIDPRAAFATQARFPDTDIHVEFPDEVLEGIGLDRHSAVVTLSHDPKIDDPAIEAALSAEVAYLGCLGSTRTHAKRIERLCARGFSDTQIARIHGPVGLNIGAATPGEIAAAILAELIAELRKS